MVSFAFYSVPVLQQSSPRKDLKILKGYLWFLCRLVQARSPLDLRACEYLLSTAKRKLIPLILRVFKPLVFLQPIQIHVAMAAIWGSAFDVSTFNLKPIILFVHLFVPLTHRIGLSNPV